MKNKIGIFPGSFDPITIGHEDIILRAANLFDEVVVAIGINTNKNYMFPIQERINMIEKTFAEHPSIRVESYNGLTIDFCKKINASHIIRGVRNTIDFEYEKNIAEINKEISGIETVLFYSNPQYVAINSTIVRDLIKHEGNYKKYLPKQIQ